MTLIDEVRARRQLPAPDIARRIRQDAHVSQARLAQELHVTRATVARWESGARTPRGANLIAYSAILLELGERSA